MQPGAVIVVFLRRFWRWLHHNRIWIFACLGVLLLGFWVYGSDSFQFCLENGGPEYQDAKFYKSAAFPIASDNGDWESCLGYFLEENDRAIGAISILLIGMLTFVLAVSTIGLWRQTARLAELARAQSEDTKASIAAAQKSAAVAERALTELERHTIRNPQAGGGER
jgi:hypothetical protein